MSGPILLPSPLASSSLLLGELIVDPLNPEHHPFHNSSAPSNRPIIQASYKNLIKHDDQGQLVSSLADQPHSPDDNVVLVQAEQMSYSSINSPFEAFDALRCRSSSQTYLRKMALHDRPLYYVTGIQKLKNPTFRKALVKEGSIAEAPASPDTKIRLPIHARRDSALDLEETSNDAVFGVELRKVRCRVGSPEEPHSVEDIGYSWTYHELDGNHDLQLAIGLGSVLEAAELRALAGIVSDEDFTDEEYDSDAFSDEGLAGF